MKEEFRGTGKVRGNVANYNQTIGYIYMNLSRIKIILTKKICYFCLMCLCEHMHVRVSDPLKLELQVVVSLLILLFQTKPKSSIREVSALNH